LSGSRRRNYPRHFQCPVCGARMDAYKKRKTKIGHIKTMWCWGCQEIRDFIQIEGDTFEEKHEEGQKGTDQEPEISIGAEAAKRAI